MAQGVPALGVAAGLEDLGDRQVPARAKGDSSTGGGAEEGPRGELEEEEGRRAEGSEKGSPPAAPEKSPWNRDPLAAQGEPGSPKSWCCFMKLCSQNRKTDNR